MLREREVPPGDPGKKAKREWLMKVSSVPMRGRSKERKVKEIEFFEIFEPVSWGCLTGETNGR